MPVSYKIRISNDLAELLRSLHPGLRKKIKSSLQAIISDPSCGKTLRDELKGYRSFRVGRFRIIYRLSGKKREIDIVAIGPRKYIYEETYKLLKKADDE